MKKITPLLLAGMLFIATSCNDTAKTNDKDSVENANEPNNIKDGSEAMNDTSNHLSAGTGTVVNDGAAPASAQENTQLSDAEIASVAVAANKIDIDAAALAKSKSKNVEILQFAKTMATDHQAVLDKATALVTKLGVTPKDNALSRQLMASANQTTEMLREKKGRAFDKAYIDNEVAYHKAVTSALNGRLVPESQNSELKDLLQSVVPAFNAHLEHAQMLQKKFK